MIQKWIKRIPIYICNITELDGGNEYFEGKGFIDAPKERAEAEIARRKYHADLRNNSQQQAEDVDWQDVESEPDPPSKQRNTEAAMQCYRQ